MSIREGACRAALLTVFAWFAIGGVAQATDFAQPPSGGEGVGGFPTESAVGDFDGDGHKDLATVNAGDDNVSILLGDGTGDFDSAGPTDDVSEIPNAITAADFNGDGKLDLATAGAGTLSGGDDVRVLLGDGTGHFTLKPLIAVGATPVDIVSADFNGDGKKDLATADKDAGSITILLGDGTGGFSKPGTSPETTDTGRPYALATGDFNGDGKTDLAATIDSPDGVSILLGAGNGNFTAAGTSPETTSGFPSDVVATDLNGDGKQDLAVSSGSANTVDILLGAGTGDFTSAPTSPETVGDGASGITAADFDGDGIKDLATSNFEFDYANSVPKQGSVTILMGVGGGNYTEASTSPERAQDGANAITTSDFDEDGRPDLVVTNYWGGSDTILLNQTPDRTGADLLTPAGSPEPAGDSPFSVATADFNGDGKADLATANYDVDNLTISLGAGSGDFTAAGTSPETVGDQPRVVTTGDFNGDGKPDLATVNQGDNDVSILLGAGTGNFTAAATSPEAAGSAPFDIVVGDFNSDGKQDLAIANVSSANVTILMGDGTGNFTAAATSPEAVGGGPGSLVAGDFNRDGKQDLAVADSDDKVTILLGAGTGNFTAAAATPSAGGSPNAIVTGDFNGDGKGDLATTNPFDNGVTVLLGDGSGGFTAAATSPEPVGNLPLKLVTGDFDGNGKLDLAVANQFSSDVSVLLGTGTGNFTAASTSPEAVGGLPTGIATADFDNDGKQDLATGNKFSGDVTILLGDDLPTAMDDTKNLTEDDPATTIDVLANDTDTDGGPKSVGAKTDGDHGTVAIANSGADLTYTPNADYCGPDTFTYSLNGGSTADVDVTVACVDDAPVAVGDSKTVTQDDPSATTIDVLANDTDVDAGPKSIASKTDGAHGQVAITNGGADLTYTTSADYCGTDSFTYTLAPGSSTATVNITVTCVNAAPRNVSAGTSYAISEGDPLQLDGSATDRENDPLSYSWDIDDDGAFDDATGKSPKIGSAELASLGIADGPSTHQIGLRVSDGALETTAAPVTLTVRNSAPALQITGSADGLSDKTFDLELTATDPSPADQSGQFAYALDDGADGTVDESREGPSAIDVTRSIGERGTFTLGATATDRDSGASPVATISLRLASLRKACKAKPTKLLFGSSAADKIKGTKGNDLIATAAGSDTISSGSGDDCVKAGKGDDKIKAGSGEDAAFGQVGNDVIDISARGAGLAVCGPGKDTAIVGRGDHVKGCERVRR